MRYGVVDLGGEEVTLVVAETTPTGQVRTIRRDTVVLRLTRHLDRQQRLPLGMVELVVETVRRMAAIAERSGCSVLRTRIVGALAGTDGGAALAYGIERVGIGPVEVVPDLLANGRTAPEPAVAGR